MILTQWRARRASRRLIDQLHGKIVAAARRPALFSELGAPDSFDGRFEMVTLFAGLVLRRLTMLSGTGAELADELVDSVFQHFEIALREIGIGDVGVSKRLKKMAAAFYGRNRAYGQGLDEPESDKLAEALARNVYGAADVASAPMARPLARVVRAAAEALDHTPLETFARGEVAFPELNRPLAAIEG
ncbi:MAG: ubiquinol-cytochrome C chaperone [Alphaproteobacteria bacterium]|nr:ubiquinol-cytochrome C chaperone [Alphaproteobacteria bacterium]